MKKSTTLSTFVFILFFINLTNIDAQWQQTNGPFSGIVSAIETDGTRLYASCRGGGLYRSDDNGDPRFHASGEPFVHESR